MIRPETDRRFQGFHELSTIRLRDILLVSSPYDAFVLEADGQLSERILSEYLDLELRHIPRLTRVSTPEEAMKALEERPFSLVISMTRVSNTSPLAFRERVKKLHPAMPVAFLSYEAVEPGLCEQLRADGTLDRVFFWSGDAKILLAVIKSVEDALNAAHDTAAGVQVILVIEDSYRYYSLFLPLIYAEIFRQTRHHIMEGVNDLHRLYRMRARPKILLAETFEQGMEFFDTYKQNLLGVISDVRFPRRGCEDPRAGLRFAELVKAEVPDLPMLLHSAELENREEAWKRGMSFLPKTSDLLSGLRTFIQGHFGFGDFVFRTPEGTEIARATNLAEMARSLGDIDERSLEYHCTRNHLSIWLRARTEFQLAEDLRPRKISDYDNLRDMRKDIVARFEDHIRRQQHGVVKDLRVSTLGQATGITRIGEGSLGGKARGLAHMNATLADPRSGLQVPGARVRVPPTFALCTDLYRRYLERNGLRRDLLLELPPAEVTRRFLGGTFDPATEEALAHIARCLDGVLMVRSSGSMEDIRVGPETGLYRTLALNTESLDAGTRLVRLRTAVQEIYASVFSGASRAHAVASGYRVQDENMAVIVQPAVGRRHGARFYPTLSGLARSVDFYTFGSRKPESGVVALALGFGRSLSGGDRIFRYCPQEPRMVGLPGTSLEQISRTTQTHFWAVDLEKPDGGDDPLVRLPIEVAEEDGTLQHVASTFTPDGLMRDTLAVEGTRVVRFAQILKSNALPLNPVLQELLSRCAAALGAPVEIKFAAEVPLRSRDPLDVALLQVRPMVLRREYQELDLESIDRRGALVLSTGAMGHGTRDGLRDVVFVDPAAWDATRTTEIAAELETLDAAVGDAGYVLVGFGRFAAANLFQGIPVAWSQVSHARVFVEAERPGLLLDPRMGSPLFHDIASRRLAYLSIRLDRAQDHLDLEWLGRLRPVHRTAHLRHVRLDKPLQVEIDGRTSRGVIHKPR